MRNTSSGYQMDDNPSDANPANEGPENTQKDFGPADSNVSQKSGVLARILRTGAEIIILGGVGTGLWVYGEHLRDNGHITLAIWINILACILFFTTLPLCVIKFWSRPKIVWGCHAGICILIVLAFVLSQKAPESDGSPTGVLVPANEPMPELSMDSAVRGLDIAWRRSPKEYPLDDSFKSGYLEIPKDELIIFLGPLALSTPDSEFAVLRLYKKDLVKLSRAGSGISVSTDIFGPDGKIMATVTSNKFQVSLKNAALFERPDPHSLVVYDDKKVPVLSIRYINRQTIKITGVFRGDGETPVVVDDHEITFGNIVLGPGRCLHLQGNRLLEWPAVFNSDMRMRLVRQVDTNMSVGMISVDHKLVIAAIRRGIVIPLVTVSSTNSWMSSVTFQIR